MVVGYGKILTRILRAHGWRLHRHAKGDHAIWIGPDGGKVTVDNGTRSRILANAILKQAGIDERI